MFVCEDAMLPARLPVSDIRRQRLRDDRLWLREVKRARQLNVRKLHCPCTKCEGRSRILIKNVREHLIQNGRHPECRLWRGPGNRDSSDEDWEREFWAPSERRTVTVDAQVNTREMLENAFPITHEADDMEDRVREEVAEAFVAADAVHEDCSMHSMGANLDTEDGGPDDETTTLEAGGTGEEPEFDPTELQEAMQQLYAGARCTKLAATILLMNVCTVHGVSNNCADELFTILHRHILPQENCLPRNHHAARSLTQKLGLSYNSIHACDKGCVLFRGEHAHLLRCPQCNGPRYKDEDRQKFPVKVLRHFPIIPRLRKIFRSPSISKLMTWHSENRSDRDGGDGLIRHPCDSKAWRHFHENVDPTFGNDPRNVHFALAADGVNPFKQNRSSWSTWPVLLLNYNLPPWLSTKKFFVLLALLIPGRQSVTCQVFDVYLEPLVQELLQLWEGVPAFDIGKEVGDRRFVLRAMLLWTIHDFPGYGMVGGFSHQGFSACPWCGSNLGAEHSQELAKMTFGGTRRWLPPDHRYRSAELKDHFTGAVEERAQPAAVTVEEQMQHAQQFQAWKEAGNREGAAGDPSKIHGVKRLSTLHTLPYWKVVGTCASTILCFFVFDCLILP